MRLIDADALSRDFCPGETYRAGEIQDVIDAAPTVEPVGTPDRLNGWISVEDELPEKNVPVLVWEKRGFSYVDRLEAECAWQIASTHHAIVTHWMPLPEPPEGDE